MTGAEPLVSYCRLNRFLFLAKASLMTAIMGTSGKPLWLTPTLFN